MEEKVDFREFIDKVLSRVDVVSVISRYLPLKRKGRTFWGCCPFHHEKEPSFAVNDEKQFYHCFGCKESGNAIGFVQKMESVEFMDALKIVAEMAKMEVPSFKRDENQTQTIDKEKKDRLLSLLRCAGKHYHENLSSPKAKEATQYINYRALDKNIVTRFGLGYSIDGEEMIKYLVSQGYTHAEIKEAGIAEIKGDRYYDVFYNRLIIPIINNFNEIVGFGGRLLNKESHIAVKYRNTSATPVFDKSKIIFGINLLKRKKQKENIKYVIVTEGYMDVMALHQAGFDTAVASMGTAFTYQQAKAIKNYTNNVYVSFDGDSAGQKATMRGLDILQESGLNVKVVSLPDELDPDDLIKQRGKGAYEKLLKEALTLTAFKLKVLKGEYDMSTPDGKSAYTVAAINVLKKLENPIEREEYLKNVHDYTGYSMDALRAQIGISEEKKEQVRVVEEKKEVEVDLAELFIISSFVHSMPYVKVTDDIYPYLISPTSKKLYEFAIDKIKSGQKINPSALFTTMGEEVEKFVQYEFIEGNGEVKYRSCLAKIKEKWLLEEKKRLSEQYTQSKDAKLLVEIMRIEEKLKQVKFGGYDD